MNDARISGAAGAELPCTRAALLIVVAVARPRISPPFLPFRLPRLHFSQFWRGAPHRREEEPGEILSGRPRSLWAWTRTESVYAKLGARSTYASYASTALGKFRSISYACPNSRYVGA